MSRFQCSRARVVFDGQSLNWYPLPPGRNYPTQLMNGAHSGTPWHNAAVSGSSWTVLSRTRGLRLQPWATIAGYGVLVLCGGTTDLGSELDTAATVYSDMAAYTASARAGGFDYVIATTITPGFIITGPQETERVAANNLIRADASGAFNAVCDFAANPDLDDRTDTTYYADGLHWTEAGAASAASQMVPFVTTALAAL